MLRIAGLVLLLSIVALPAMGQSHQPYAGLADRTLKALSDEQVRDLQEGRGMGLATTQGSLRETHLKYHLATVAILSPDQVRRYSELRGYAAGGAQHAPGGHHHRSH